MSNDIDPQAVLNTARAEYERLQQAFDEFHAKEAARREEIQQMANATFDLPVNFNRKQRRRALAKMRHQHA